MPAYVIIEPDRLVDRDTAIGKLKELGVEALLTLRVTDKQTVQSPIPQPGKTGLSTWPPTISISAMDLSWTPRGPRISKRSCLM